VTRCANCAANAETDRGGNALAVARLTTGYVALHPCQYFRGMTMFVAKRCVAELYELPRDERAMHLHEMAEVATALSEAFAPRKLNYEALGNSVPHLHWWLTPRYDDDPRPFAPIWEDLDFLRVLWTGSGRHDRSCVRMNAGPAGPLFRCPPVTPGVTERHRNRLETVRCASDRGGTRASRSWGPRGRAGPGTGRAPSGGRGRARR
jgi:diadenosine tetraphosphate (Ap4A) HIT family hydrolase